MSFAVLFLCTGNQCRSPLAAAFAEQRLAGRDVVIRSAGLLPGGLPVPPEGMRIAREYHLDLSGHVSRRFDRELADDADLILTMTKSQGREVVTSEPECWPRVFTLKSFVQWLPRQELPDSGISRPWLERAARGRSPHELLGSSTGDEVEDPMGRSMRVWRRVSAELSDAVNRLAPAFPAPRRVPAR